MGGETIQNDIFAGLEASKEIINKVIKKTKKTKKPKKKKNIQQERRKLSNKWKEKIRKRDKNQCQCCGKKMNSKLEIHHLLPFAKYPELMRTRGNVICLCHECHQFYHKLYKGNENGTTFAKFLRDYGTIMKR